MEHSDLLDDKDDDNLILGIVQWWEQRRLRYNLIVGGVGVLAIFFISTMINLIIHQQIVLYMIFVYGLIANTAYLLGWVLEILLRYYFNITLGKQSRNVLYWLGVFVSILPILGVLMGVSSAI